MPILKRVPNEAEQKKLIEIFLKAETDIINEIGRLRSLGLADYHEIAALERVQAILRKMESDCWEYTPQMIEKMFYARVPEARRMLTTAEKSLAAYKSAETLTAEQSEIVQRLTMNLMGEITEATAMTMGNLQNMVVGRVDPDIYRKIGLEQVAIQQAKGEGIAKSVPGFVEKLKNEGLTAFIDKAGRRWDLHTYCSMVMRTTSRQAEILAVLTAEPEQDLYKISSHGSSCPLCAPYEGRVYSKSGKDPVFPPLAEAFGKIDPNGGNDLSNTYLNIHPNCLHVLLPWSIDGKSEEEIRKAKEFSDPRKNPFTRDPRTQKQIEAYHRKEEGRRKWLADYRQWEKYRITIPDKVPKTFNTFQKHKLADDEKYKSWLKEYRQFNDKEENIL